MEEKKIQCPNCGGPNTIIDHDQEQICVFCSASFIAKEVEDNVTKIKPENEKTYNWMVMAETARNGGDYLEAISYYNKILEENSSHAASWFGKGTSIIWKSTLGDIKMSEALNYYKNAIKFSKEPKKMKKAIADDLNGVVVIFFPNIQNHYKEFKSIEGSASEYWQRFQILESGLAYALDCDPDNVNIIDNGLKLISDVGVDLLLQKNTKDLKQKYIDAKQKIDPEWKPKTIGCFVATATMGDYNHPTVLQLRLFRDNFLLQRKWGCIFTRLYYKWAPYPAKIIAKSNLLKKISYLTIVKPLSFITSRLKEYE